MRVWLVDEQPGESAPPLESILRQLAERGRTDGVAGIESPSPRTV